MSRSPVRTVFLGTGTFAAPVLDALSRVPEVLVVGVVTAPARPAGRGGSLRASPVAAHADKLGLEVVMTPPRLRDPEAIERIAGVDPGLLVLADYGQIVPRAILELPRHGALNLHPSLLPRHRGAAPVPAAIIAGDTQTGVTLMVMDEGLDTGPVIAQVAVPLDGTEDAPGLERRLALEAGALLTAVLPDWLAGVRSAVPQATGEATLTRPFLREDGRIDSLSPAAELERRVRALQPWPGSWVDTAAGRLTIWRARPLALRHLPVSRASPAGEASGPAGSGMAGADRPARLSPGTLVPDGEGLALVVGDGALRLDEVQLAGGRRMTSAELRRGHRSLAGSAVS